MIKIRALVEKILPKREPKLDPLMVLLSAFNDPEADTLKLMQSLIGYLRPKNKRDEGFVERYAEMLDRLEQNSALCEAFRSHILRFLANRRLLTFFTDSGILPGTGFFSEWWRILGNYILPEVPDERRLKDCLHIIYDKPDDWVWMEKLPPEYSERWWKLLGPVPGALDSNWRAILGQMLDSVLLLSHRVSGLGVESELMRAAPNFDDNVPSFTALSAEALDYVNSFRTAFDDPEKEPDDGRQLMVIVEQCQDTLERIRKRALTVGTSIHLSYILTRSEQSLERLRELVTILKSDWQSDGEESMIIAWARFARMAYVAENRRNSLKYYMNQLSQVLAVRVTENAARSGEHYICETPADYRYMWRSAAGAGVFIGTMALLKIFAANLHAPLFVEAFLFSMIYGVGFVLIYLLGMTVATKQPAMTAQTLASLLSDIKPTRTADLEHLVDVIAAVVRSQIAAIGGNILVAFPVAIGISLGISHYFNEPLISSEKATHLIGDLDILSWAIPHAAVAGFYLFLSGLINGYFDNKSAYADIGQRIGRVRWLQRLLGSERALRFGTYIEDNLGGIMGNFLFGCMLGSTGVIGIILGLPIDIRHIAFAAANFGYALTGFQFELPIRAILLAVLGIAAIGLTNLVVSFALAFRMAMGTRSITFKHWGALFRAVIRRFIQQPRSFLWPPKQAPKSVEGDESNKPG